MQHQQWPLSQEDAGFALTDQQLRADQPSQDTAGLVLYVSQYALPFLLLSTLFVDLLFIVIGKIGDRMAGWETIDDDMDDVLLCAVKAKRAKRRRKLEANKKPKTRPRRLLLLSSNILLLLLSITEAVLLLIFFSAAASNRHARTAAAEQILPFIGAALAYAWVSIRVHQSSPDAVATSILFRLVSAVSLVLSILILVSALIGAYTGASVTPIFCLLLTITALKATISTIQVLAYHPKFHESVFEPAQDGQTATESSLVDPSRDPRLVTGDSAAIEEEEDDDDAECQKKKRTVYDWPSTLLRFKRLLPFMLPGSSRLSYALIVICILLAVTVNVAVILQPQQFGLIVNDLVAHRSPWHNLLVWALMRTALNGGTITVLRKALWNPVSSKISRNMDNMTCMIYHSNKRSGEVLSVLRRGGSSLSNCLEYLLFQFSPLFINIAGSSLVLATHFGTSVIAIIAATAVAYIATLQFFRGEQAILLAEYTDRLDNTSAVKNESISNVELLKYFGMEPYEIDRYGKALLHKQKADWVYRLYLLVIRLVQDNVQVVGTVAGACLIALKVYVGEVEVGVFVMYLTYIGSIMNSLERIRFMSEWVNGWITDTDKLIDILDEKNEIVDANDAVELYDCTGEISFENVTLTYLEKGKKPSKKPARKALDDVSFSVLPGQHVALVGESGAGKSTIFRLLYRFYEPQEGCIKVEGKDIRQYTQRSLRQALGLVQQEGMVFNDSVFGNIKYGDITAPDAKVIEAAKIAQIHDRIVEWPRGYETVVGERGVKLSGGEKQRVNIARTILKNPKVLLLDEATSALDSNTEKAIQGQLKQLTRGKTTISIAHRLSTVAHADKIIVLHKGKIVETGTHDELLKIDGGVYKKLWTTQTASANAAGNEEADVEDV